MTALPELTLDLSTLGDFEWEVTERPDQPWTTLRAYDGESGDLVLTLLVTREQWQGLLSALRAHDNAEPADECGEGGGARVTELRALRETGR